MKKKGNLLKKEAVQAEQWTGAHLVMVGVYTAFSILLIIFTLILSWEMWMIPLLIIGIISVWFIHISQFGTEQFQRYLYITLMLVELFYYGAHEDGFFDLPLAMSVLILVLPTFDEVRLVYVVVATYLVEVLYHVCFHDRIRVGIDMVTLARLILGIAAVFTSAWVSRLLIIRRRDERKEFRKMIDTLKETNRRSEDFLANVSHELRTPINAVTGISDLMLQKELPSDLRADMFSIQEAGKRLAGRIDDILDYMDLVTEHIALSREDYLISSSVNDMITMAATQNKDSGLEMVFDVDADLPSALIGDEAKIRRVVKILLENAIKFTEKGGIYIHIGCRREAYGINLGIDISDTGIGMTTQQLAKVYQEFYQADSSRTRKNSGLGLGMAIAHGMVHTMGGFMNITSALGKGSQMHISIPHLVENEEPCMAIRDQGAQYVGCYVRQDRYSGEIREYYERTLKNLGNRLGIKIQYLYYFSDLQSLLGTGVLTHLVVAQAEYEENPEFFEKLGSTLYVALIAEYDFKLPEGSCMFLLYKPFCGFSVVNFINESGSQSNSRRELNPLGSISCEGVKALVVDDEAMNLTVAKGILSNYGMEVDASLGGEEALGKCMENEYDLVFLDHMMPVMDGVETLRQIRKICNGKYEHLPVIALTANAVSGARDMFKSEGFDEFVAKPIERSVLERILRRVLPNKCKRVEIAQEIETDELQSSKETSSAADSDSYTEESAASPVVLLKQNGFNVKQAIGYCAGSEDFYLEILDNYYSESKEKQTELSSYFDNQDWANYTIKVHALKSASRTIGADGLSDCAAKLEQAGKNGDVKYIEENHPILMGLYEECQALIAVCTGAKLEEESPSESEAKDNMAQEIPEEVWQQAMEGLATAFDTFESDAAESIIKELSEYTRHGHSCKELLEKISRCVEDFDFDAAGEELHRLLGEGEIL